VAHKGQAAQVRIAVAVDQDGAWSAIDNCAYRAGESIRLALDALPPTSSPVRQVVCVTANVSLPASAPRKRKSSGKKVKKRGK
jgi:hypothetical protein